MVAVSSKAESPSALHTFANSPGVDMRTSATARPAVEGATNFTEITVPNLEHRMLTASSISDFDRRAKSTNSTQAPGYGAPHQSGTMTEGMSMHPIEGQDNDMPAYDRASPLAPSPGNKRHPRWPRATR